MSQLIASVPCHRADNYLGGPPTHLASATDGVCWRRPSPAVSPLSLAGRLELGDGGGKSQLAENDNLENNGELESRIEVCALRSSMSACRGATKDRGLHLTLTRVA